MRMKCNVNALPYNEEHKTLLWLCILCMRMLLVSQNVCSNVLMHANSCAGCTCARACGCICARTHACMCVGEDMYTSHAMTHSCARLKCRISFRILWISYKLPLNRSGCIYVIKWPNASWFNVWFTTRGGITLMEDCCIYNGSLLLPPDSDHTCQG